MAIAYSGQRVELREVVLKNKPAEFISLSAKATVPVLQLPGGKVLEESLDIVYWALGLNDPSDWLLNGDDALHSLARNLIQENDFDFKVNLDLYKYYPRADGEETQKLSQEDYRQLGEVFLTTLNSRLEEHPFLMGKTISIADICIFPFIRQFAFVDKPWFDALPYKSLLRWLAYFLPSELFNSVMKKYDPYIKDSSVNYFPAQI